MSDSLLKAEWPQRLLHVPTMTSVQKKDGNLYRSDKEPAYNILSYTWGRFQVARGTPAFAVSWPIPAIDEQHFSRTSFQKAIMNVSLGRASAKSHRSSPLPVSYVWIDVICIDQEDERIKAIEIGRQAAIFKNASRAYVWLNRLNEIDLQFCDKFLFDSSDKLSRLSENNDFESVFDEFWTEECIHVLQLLLQDPWFTSLWTLQEMFLRADAIILSKTSEPIQRKGGDENPLGLANLIVNCTSIYNTFTRRALDTRRALSPSFTTILDLIEMLGLYHGPWENSTLLFGAVKHRQTREPKDRVYGIMQVYGFKLGTSVQPDRDFTLEDLEFQLAASHNAQSPISAQLFVHTRVIELGKCWRMDVESKLPYMLQIVERDRGSACEISSSESGLPTVTGKACHMEDIVDVWREASSGTTRSPASGRVNAIQDIILDATDFSLGTLPDDLQNLHLEDDRKQHELGALLVDTFGDSIKVLLLGSLIDGVDEDVELCAGLLLVFRHLDSTSCWQRIGVCLWEQMEDSLGDRLEECFHEFEGLLG